MTFDEAVRSCREGNFLTNKNFGSDQSMHMYKGELYYEDGCCLTHHLHHLQNEEWFKEGWDIKYPKDRVDTVKLDKIHQENSKYTLFGKSYEECIII